MQLHSVVGKCLPADLEQLPGEFCFMDVCVEPVVSGTHTRVYKYCSIFIPHICTCLPVLINKTKRFTEVTVALDENKYILKYI